MASATEVIWNKRKTRNKFNEWFVFVCFHHMMQSSLKRLLTNKTSVNKPVEGCNFKSSHQDIFNGNDYFEKKRQYIDLAKPLNDILKEFIYSEN